MSAAPSSVRALPFGFAALLLAFLVAAHTVVAQDAAGGVNDMMMLTTSPPETAKDADYGLLLREVGRQALLIAAREQLHLPTRDEAIGDPVPAEARPFDASVLVRPKASYRIRLSRDGNVAWEKEIPIEQRGKAAADIDQVVEKFEALSRGELVAALKKAGLAPHPAAAQVA